MEHNKQNEDNAPPCAPVGDPVGARGTGQPRVDADYEPCLTAWCPKCDRLVFATVISVADKKSLAKEVAACVRQGLTLQTIPAFQVREAQFGHRCKPAAVQSPQTEPQAPSGAQGEEK